MTPPQERAELPLLLDENGKTKTREQLWQDQQGRLRADLDQLATGEIIAPAFAEVLYGETWQTELSEYEKRKDLQAFVFTGSIVCAATGGLVYVWWVLLWTGRLVVKAASGLKRLIKRPRGAAEQDEEEKPEPADAEDTPPEEDADEQEEEPARPRITVKPTFTETVEREPRPMGSMTKRPTYPLERERILAPAAYEKSSDSGASVAGASKREEFGEQSKPIDNTLSDLTMQVSAIREYAASQQGRLEKLQDGYDWNIIRTFCLRVIRAVDNLDNRIVQLKEDDVETIHLEEVRDELIFALESSGIEQFEPETDSEYRGQEKLAEAVKDKQSCDDPEQAGKIANVIRPGYQYFINEENVKIVRPAQVRLYA
jgi:molecular chaperone GrpE (heat shock protein)